VALDLERDRLAAAEVEDTGVLARPLEDALAAAGQPLEQRRGVLVAAVLRPEKREDRELEVVRVAAEQLPDAVQFAVGEPEGAVELLVPNLRQEASVSRLPDGALEIGGKISRRGPPVRYKQWMSRRHAVMLAALSLIWGASFMFIKVAVRQVSPATLVAARVGIGALTLALVVPLILGGRRTAGGLLRHAPSLILVGLVNTALPFFLLSWGETRIDSGLAAIIQGAVPIFGAVVAFAFFPAQRVTGLRLAGLAVGFVGVALTVGAQPEGQLLGALAVVGMAVCYAVGGLLAGHLLRDAPPQVVTLGTTLVAALAVLGPGIVEAPAHMPGWKTIGSIAALGVAGTALAYLLFFELIRGAGFSRASLVTYLVPPIALLYGAGFLGESFGAAALGGLALILGGVGLASRARRMATVEA
jgi:drug/metabolite transporter (DMT)-like permease